MKFNVYNRQLEVNRHQGQWRVLILGSEGKKRLGENIVIPADVREDELMDYLADLCHEWSREGHVSVTRLA